MNKRNFLLLFTLSIWYCAYGMETPSTETNPPENNQILIDIRLDHYSHQDSKNVVYEALIRNDPEAIKTLYAVRPWEDFRNQMHAKVTQLTSSSNPEFSEALTPLDVSCFVDIDDSIFDFFISVLQEHNEDNPNNSLTEVLNRLTRGITLAGNSAKLKKILSYNNTPLIGDEGYNLLHWSFIYGNEDCITFLIDHYPELNTHASYILKEINPFTLGMRLFDQNTATLTAHSQFILADKRVSDKPVNNPNNLKNSLLYAINKHNFELDYNNPNEPNVIYTICGNNDPEIIEAILKRPDLKKLLAPKIGCNNFLHLLIDRKNFITFSMLTPKIQQVCPATLKSLLLDRGSSCWIPLSIGINNLDFDFVQSSLQSLSSLLKSEDFNDIFTSLLFDAEVILKKEMYAPQSERNYEKIAALLSWLQSQTEKMIFSKDVLLAEAIQDNDETLAFIFIKAGAILINPNSKSRTGLHQACSQALPSIISFAASQDELTQLPKESKMLLLENIKEGYARTLNKKPSEQEAFITSCAQLAEKNQSIFENNLIPRNLPTREALKFKNILHLIDRKCKEKTQTAKPDATSLTQLFEQTTLIEKSQKNKSKKKNKKQPQKNSSTQTFPTKNPPDMALSTDQLQRTTQVLFPSNININQKNIQTSDMQDTQNDQTEWQEVTRNERAARVDTTPNELLSFHMIKDPSGRMKQVTVKITIDKPLTPTYNTDLQKLQNLDYRGTTKKLNNSDMHHSFTEDVEKYCWQRAHHSDTTERLTSHQINSLHDKYGTYYNTKHSFTLKGTLAIDGSRNEKHGTFEFIVLEPSSQQSQQPWLCIHRCFMKDR